MTKFVSTVIVLPSLLAAAVAFAQQSVSSPRAALPDDLKNVHEEAKRQLNQHAYFEQL